MIKSLWSLACAYRRSARWRNAGENGAQGALKMPQGRLVSQGDVLGQDFRVVVIAEDLGIGRRGQGFAAALLRQASPHHLR